MHKLCTIVISLVSTPLLFSSCADDFFQSDENTFYSGSAIAFSATESTERSNVSRRYEPIDTITFIDESDDTQTLHCETYEMPLTSTTPTRVLPTVEASNIEQIGVIADASWFEPRLMDNDLYSRDNNGVYKSEDIRYWIDDADASIDFYAFSPYNPKGLTLPKEKGSAILTYTVPASTDDQADLMLAVNKGVSADYGQTVGLEFKHLLAGVKFNLKYPSNSTVTEVSLSGLTNSATLDFSVENPSWSDGSDHNLRVTDGEIANSAQFMVLPQTMTDAQPVTLSITVEYGPDDVRTYSHTITAGEWRMGINTIYEITITNYSFRLTEVTPADAHYVIYRTDVIAENLPDGTEWTITCSASDDANVSIQNQDDLNTFAQQGFWTDEIIEGSNHTSARGDKSLTLSGNGTFPVAIFMPENATDNNRSVTLNIRVNGKDKDEKPLEITQLHPAWTNSGFGWEQTDDNINGEYGFKWNRVLYYGYVYNNGIGEHSSSNNRAYCQQVIDDNNAGEYAEPYQYNSGFLQTRWAIKIDYGKLTDISSIAYNNDDGLNNTKGLFNYGGAAATNSFVDAIESIKKTENDHETENAFRLGNGSSGEAPAPEGDPITQSTAVGECIKKNRYNIRREISQGNISLTPTISDEDIVWYMPAVGQFSSIPGEIVDPITAAGCWSSTCVDDRANSYLGNGTQADRLTTHSIRAVRNHP